MKTSNLSTGRLGDDEACRYLLSIGHRILFRNWRSSHLEIDIISEDPEGIHIVEVKTRRSRALAAPERNVDFRKRLRLVRAANAFLHSGAVKGCPDLFFDVVSVVLDGDGVRLEYFPKAFIPLRF